MVGCCTYLGIIYLALVLLVTARKEVRQMMEHIIKSLATKDTATVILVLGLVREARLWHKQYLAYKLKDKELKKK